jgi:hypothetical protein
VSGPLSACFLPGPEFRQESVHCGTKLSGCVSQLEMAPSIKGHESSSSQASNQSSDTFVWSEGIIQRVHDQCWHVQFTGEGLIDARIRLERVEDHPLGSVVEPGTI